MHPEFETERLRLRSFNERDLDPFSALTSNEGFMRFSGTGPIGREETAAMLERIMVRTRAGQPAQFAVFLRGQHKLIGYCGFFFQTVDGVNDLEVAYRIHPDYWGRGLATEGAQAVRDHAFQDLRLERLISLIHPDNHASRRVAEKNGMTLERRTTFKDFPALVFAISRQHWGRLPCDARRTLRSKHDTL